MRFLFNTASKVSLIGYADADTSSYGQLTCITAFCGRVCLTAPAHRASAGRYQLTTDTVTCRPRITFTNTCADFLRCRLTECFIQYRITPNTTPANCLHFVTADFVRAANIHQAKCRVIRDTDYFCDVLHCWRVKAAVSFFQHKVRAIRLVHGRKGDQIRSFCCW